MSLHRRLQRLLQRPPREIISRVLAFAHRQRAGVRQSVRDRFKSTFPADGDITADPLQRLISPIASDDLSIWRSLLIDRANQICQHRFNLLGSGLVSVDIGMLSAGLEGHRYAPMESRSINRFNRSKALSLRRHISSGYRPIDWHRDCRSGYRWPEDVPSSSVVYGVLPGVDIKLPWELARMQHTPCLALAYSQFMLLGDEVGAARLRIEFQDQIFDFVAANPPRFGVNWACTMDVAIRIVNWLVAYDLFRGFGAQFDTDFELEFKRAVVAHGRHIIENLEWFPHLRSNHYLSNIAGLFFVAAYLPESAESNTWLALAANELGKEIFTQFQPDGSNFEGSTSYHRLSAEMVLFSVALAHRIRQRLDCFDLAGSLSQLRHSGPGVLPDNRNVLAERKLTDASVLRLLAKMATFTLAITRPDGNVVQIGDNDSGRFLKLSPDECYGDGNVTANNHQALVAGIMAACNETVRASESIDALVVNGLMNGLPRVCGKGDICPSESSSIPPDVAAFSDFGLYIYRWPQLWLSVRCGSVGQNGNGGHAHNDQLSIELVLGGVSFIVDPGTYVYTPLPSSRNAFRSTSSHATLVASPGEQNGWLEGRDGLFSMNRVANANAIEVQPRLFVGEHNGFDMPHRREIEINDASIGVTDTCYADSRLLVLPLAPGVCVTKLPSIRACLLERDGVVAEFHIEAGDIDLVDAYFSPQYGVKVKTCSIHVKAIPAVCRWEVSLREKVNG